MDKQNSILAQLRRNLVAIISLVVALTSLGYNTWRNEQSELNRNVRFAGFEMLMQAAKIRELTYLLRYDPDSISESAARSVWVTVIAIDDLSEIMDKNVQASADALRATWGANEARVRHSNEGKEAVDYAVDELVAETVALLDSLD